YKTHNHARRERFFSSLATTFLLPSMKRLAFLTIPLFLISGQLPTAAQYFYQFQNTTNSGGAFFPLAKGEPEYFLDLDFRTHNVNPSLYAYIIDFEAPGFHDFILHGLGHIEAPPANSLYLPGWTDDEWHHLHIDVDLINSRWTFDLDDRPR